ncbi:MAG: SDR family NAD(P)-dependent oxidoreductase, partial [Lachnospiraceae bacterium]|nr:SDR family NAD(P)-dependent oxidoreductase [Lachnospiraceae bacterium]
MRLKDRVTVITGASAGFGMSRGFPEGFAAEGSHLVLNYYGHPQAAMEEFRKELEETCGVKVVLVQGDISREETAKELVETAVSEFGRIDILINCAGMSKPKLLVDM